MNTFLIIFGPALAIIIAYYLYKNVEGASRIRRERQRKAFDEKRKEIRKAFDEKIKKLRQVTLQQPIQPSLFAGTSFPSNPVVNDSFFRTDLSQRYVYDGSKWVTLGRFNLKSQPRQTGGGMPVYQIGTLGSVATLVTNPVASYAVASTIISSSNIRFLHPEEEVQKKEDIVDIGFTKVRKYITEAEEIDRGHLQQLVESLRWTTDHVIGTSGPETEGALDMDLFAKLSSELIEESEKVLSQDKISKSQLRSIQLRLEGLFEFLKRYPDETPRKKEVEDSLFIVDDTIQQSESEADES